MRTALSTPVRLSFAHMGDYHVLLRDLFSMLECDIIVPPPITKRTLELGAKHSPEGACVPFKYNLGNYLEAIEKGANTFLTAGGGCRFKYYFETHREILLDLGHDVRFLQTDLSNMLRDFQQINPALRRTQFHYRLFLMLRKLLLMDELNNAIRKRIGFERTSGDHERFWKSFLYKLPKVPNLRSLRSFAQQSREALDAIPHDVPQTPFKVGVVGELYMLMEPFSNFYLEKTLGKFGVEVHRWINASTIFAESKNWVRHQRHMLKWAHPYVHYLLGAHGTESVGRVHQMVKSGFDGAIHVKPFGCMPEINAMPALQRISRDYRFPIVCFSFDSHTSEAGVQTRLEAFFDMIYHKKQGVLT